MVDSVNDVGNYSALGHEQLTTSLLAWIKSRHQQTPFKRILIAFSGGTDSTALLLALSQLREQLPAPLLAVHVNHQLHPDADKWQQHCQSLCAKLGLSVELLQAKLANTSRRGLEALAREARYTALAGISDDGDLLLTGQHANDQAETLLLHLLRGSGVDGLAAIHPFRPWNNGWLGRPLLAYSKEQLLEYVQQHNTSWIEDPSNNQLIHRRNYLRQRVMPLLLEPWPQAIALINQTSSHCQEAQQNLLDLAEIDLSQLQKTTLDQRLQRLPLTGFLQLPRRRQRLLLRSWVRLQGWQTPSKNKLADFISQLQHASTDSSCELRWLQQRMALHAGYIYLNASFDSTQTTNKYPLDEMPECMGRFSFSPSLGADYQVTSRNGGEAINLPARKGKHTLKKLFQEAGIPPWLRASIPLLWQQDHLLAVGDLWLDKDFFQHLQQAEIQFSWLPSEKPWQIFRDAILIARIEQTN